MQCYKIRGHLILFCITLNVVKSYMMMLKHIGDMLEAQGYVMVEHFHKTKNCIEFDKEALTNVHSCHSCVISEAI
jgi:hypothetical protein